MAVFLSRTRCPEVVRSVTVAPFKASKRCSQLIPGYLRKTNAAPDAFPDLKSFSALPPSLPTRLLVLPLLPGLRGPTTSPGTTRWDPREPWQAAAGALSPKGSPEGSFAERPRGSRAPQTLLAPAPRAGCQLDAVLVPWINFTDAGG